MPFKPATKEVGYVKASMFGPKGTGKTTLMAMLLLYLSKTFHNSAPVAWLASEKGVDFVVDIFKAEGVPLLLNRSRSFLDLRAASRDAISAGACAVGVDSVSHFWQDLFTEGMKQRGPRLQRIGRIKEEWAPFAQDFQDSPVHFLVTGRMGFVWDEIEMPDEKGEMVRELSKGGTKIKAEGDFGHEPDLEIETAQMDDPDLVRFEKVAGKTRKKFNSRMVHIATVKKCRVWSLNGQAFTWKDQTEYKPGYFQKVASPFEPYFRSIGIGGQHAPIRSDHETSILFQQGSSESFAEAQIKRDVALEKWQATMELVAGGQTKENIRKRAIIGELVTGTRSKTEFERKPLDAILRDVQVLFAVERRLKQETPNSDAELRKLVELAIDDIEHPGKNATMLEAMLRKSVESVRGPQPVVAVLDQLAAPF